MKTPHLHSNALHASADVLIATIAGGLVLAFFWPLTLCATGVKGVIKLFRPAPASGHSRLRHP